MNAKKIKLENFKNIESLELEFDKNINIIFGENAQGKTNLLESIWLFTGEASFRGSKLENLIKDGKDFYRSEIEFFDGERTQNIKISNGKKKEILLNRVPLKSLNELDSSFQSVVFAPTHLSLIKDGPNKRRDFLDSAISRINKNYKSYLITYKELIEQKNALLKNAYEYKNLRENIEIWDIQIAKVLTILTIYRNDYVNKLSAIAKKIYEGICDKKESFFIEYKSTVFEKIPSSYDEESVNIALSKLKESFDYDLEQRSSTIGPHRDDIDIKIDDKSARFYASQGQQRSGVIAIKLAEARLIKKITKKSPIMLLDDVLSELDEKRQDYIINSLKGMQVFLTCCDISNVKKLKSGMVIKMEDGKALYSQRIESIE